VKNLEENGLIKFTKLSKQKEGIFANFKAKGIKGGTTFTATMSIDISQAEVDPADPLEKIIEECARIAVKDFKRSELQFEGIVAL
jgi:hypothetical protein